VSDPTDRFEQLKTIRTPAPTADARRRALDASLAAFDAAQASSFRGRLNSVITRLKGSWIMDTRISMGLGTAAIALLLLPIGYQLYTSTALTPPAGGTVVVRDTDLRVAPPPPPVDEAAEADAPAPAPAEANKVAVPATLSRQEAEGRAAPARPPMEAEFAAEPKLMSEEAGMLDMGIASMPAPSPDATVALPEPSGDMFAGFDEQPVRSVAEEPVSTFALEVDTASYAYVRRALTDGFVPEPDAVRIEELINYFPYDYPAPESAETPFRPTLDVMPTPWNEGTQLVRIGLRGYAPPAGERAPANLTFLLDTSGSMDEPDKLPLLKRAFALLVEQLGPEDTVAIVAYAGAAGVVLEPTGATDKGTILSALDNLHAGGSTAGAEGIELAYRLAAQSFAPDGINRVILATDGDFNVGIEDPEALEDFIAAKRGSGVFLSVLGFGQGNLGDDTMQALAQAGNGTASYIDSFKEAQKVLVAELGGTLQTIASDVKVQVEFNPQVVSEYRLVGYETRALNREDFNNDRVDAGEIGAGLTVTALYEITPVGSPAALNDPLRYGEAAPAVSGRSDEIGYLKLRFKRPGETASTLIETPIGRDRVAPSLAAAPADARFAAAVAAFGQKLKGSAYAGDISWDEIAALAQGARGADAQGYRAEFVQLIDLAAALRPDPLCTAPEGNRNCR
jgi:Ca-activated chloride channel homolog